MILKRGPARLRESLTGLTDRPADLIHDRRHHLWSRRHHRETRTDRF